MVHVADHVGENSQILPTKSESKQVRPLFNVPPRGQGFNMSSLKAFHRQHTGPQANSRDNCTSSAALATTSTATYLRLPQAHAVVLDSSLPTHSPGGGLPPAPRGRT